MEMIFVDNVAGIAEMFLADVRQYFPDETGGCYRREAIIQLNQKKVLIRKEAPDLGYAGSGEYSKWSIVQEDGSCHLQW